MAGFEESEGFSEIFKSKLQSVVLIGASNVGKTALVYRYVLDELPPGLTSTIGVEFTRRVVIDKASGQKIQLHIWDTAGQERYKSVTKQYSLLSHYRGADACLLVYDIAAHDSFEEVPNWLAELKDHTDPDCVVCLVGNKCDLETSGQRSVARDEAVRYATSHRLMYHETSSFWPRNSGSSKDKVQGGIEYIFDRIVENVLSKHEDKDDISNVVKLADRSKSKPSGIKLDPEQIYSYHADNRCPC